MQELYRALFDKVPDFSGISLPVVNGISPVRTIFVAQEIVEWTEGRPLEGTYRALARLCFPDYPIEKAKCDLDLDLAAGRNDRSPRKHSYIVSIHDVQESNEDARHDSLVLRRDESRGQTLLEYLLHTASYFIATGGHLDERTWTRCTATHRRVLDKRDRREAIGHWVDGRLSISWIEPEIKRSYLASRLVYLVPRSSTHVRPLEV